MPFISTMFALTAASLGPDWEGGVVSVPDPDFQFRPPDRRDIWKSLALTMSQAATLTGVSERQIQHWMDQGYITPTDHGARKINGDNLDKITLIRQARNAGIPLRKAVVMAQEYLRHEVSARLGTEVATGPLQDLEQKLQDLRGDIDIVEQLIKSVESQDGTSTSARDPVARRNRVS
jgi:DNA-binding transcriptional MerR regulator